MEKDNIRNNVVFDSISCLLFKEGKKVLSGYFFLPCYSCREMGKEHKKATEYISILSQFVFQFPLHLLCTRGKTYVVFTFGLQFSIDFQPLVNFPILIIKQQQFYLQLNYLFNGFEKDGWLNGCKWTNFMTLLNYHKNY